MPMQEKSVFIKVAELICDEIIKGTYKSDDRIPSVRELAAELEINYNTVLRSMELLQREEIIYQKRGIGYFVFKDARKKILKSRQAEFRKQKMPEFFRQAELLGMSIDDIVKSWEEFHSC